MSQQHPTMSCDGNGPCASRNRHCDKCDPAEVAPISDEGAREAWGATHRVGSRRYARWPKNFVTIVEPRRFDNDGAILCEHKDGTRRYYYPEVLTETGQS